MYATSSYSLLRAAMVAFYTVVESGQAGQLKEGLEFPLSVAIHFLFNRSRRGTYALGSNSLLITRIARLHFDHLHYS